MFPASESMKAAQAREHPIAECRHRHHEVNPEAQETSDQQCERPQHRYPEPKSKEAFYRESHQRQCSIRDDGKYSRCQRPSQRFSAMEEFEDAAGQPA